MRASVAVLALSALSLLACGGELDGPAEAPSASGAAGGPSGGAAGAAGAGDAGSAGAAGAAGAAGDPSKRGDPASFPTACQPSCAAACDKLEACGAAASPVAPMTREACMTRCALAEKGPLWDDVSGNFKCCASQPACGDVARCGAWLELPSTRASCKTLCQCFFGGMGVEEAWRGRAAPEGYRFAVDAVAVREVTASLPPGVRARPFGAGRLLTASGALDAGALAGKVDALPTFRDGAGRLAVATGRVVVSARSEGERARAAVGLARHGLSAPARLAYAAHLYVSESSDAWAALDAVAALRARGVDAELDLLREYSVRAASDDPLLADQWHLEDTGQRGATPGVDARVTEAWSLTRGSPDVVLAVLDDGVDLDHPDLAPNLAGTTINFPDDWRAKRDAADFGQHGSSCAGVAAARGDNAEGGSGVCPTCKLLPALLAETTGGQFQITDTESAKRFVDIVDAGAWVISNSWGISTGDPRFKDAAFQVPKITKTMAAALDYAETKGRGGKGTVIVFAAGNDNSPLDSTAAYDSVVAVGAVDAMGLKSYYSNVGKQLDVAAPSNGARIGVTTTAAGKGGAAKYTDEFGGTSSACPLVAGVIGLMLSANPAMTAAEVRAALAATANPIDPVYGNYDEDGRSVYYGAGLVDAYAAVKRATGACSSPESCAAPSDLAATPKRGAASACRTGRDCESGVCQAIAALGATVCVGTTTPGGACAAGELQEGLYCLPTRESVGMCLGAEAPCNGRDDDCSGQTDDGAAACGSLEGAFCPSGQGDCAAGELCAGVGCVKACAVDADCGDGRCLPVKSRYGVSDKSVKGCSPNALSGCQMGCEVLAASLTDAAVDAFVGCMKDGAATCGAVTSCAGMLPVKL
ncbi:MAG: S8 family serine peptidase [Polyangiaceae bacterium]|nr:S8 family serine peptidase [Polyangiaceae bacterium]